MSGQLRFGILRAGRVCRFCVATLWKRDAYLVHLFKFMMALRFGLLTIETVRVAQGLDAVRISMHAVERDLDEVSTPEKVQSFLWNDRGHTFYALSHDNFTWVFDLTTRFWHQRKSSGRNNWRCNHAFEFGGNKLFGDAVNGTVYQQSNDVFDEAGEPLMFEVVLPITHATPERLTMNSLRIDAVTGTAKGNAEAFLHVRVSTDNANSWGKTRKLSLGHAGEHTKRLHAHRFGTSKEDGFVVQIRSPDRAVRSITGISADLEKIGV